jgi:phospholipase/carboxylesterase
MLEANGLEVDYHESDAEHHVDPADVPAAVAWLERTIVPMTAGKRLRAWTRW